MSSTSTRNNNGNNRRTKQPGRSQTRLSVTEALDRMLNGKVVHTGEDGVYLKYNTEMNHIDRFSSSDKQATKAIDSIEISEFIRTHMTVKFSLYQLPATSFQILQPCVRRPNGTYVLSSRVHRTIEDVMNVNHVIGYRICDIIPLDDDKSNGQ